MLAGDASRQEVKELLLNLDNLVRTDEQLQHLLQLVQENHLLAGASPRPKPDEALVFARYTQQKQKTSKDDNKEAFVTHGAWDTPVTHNIFVATRRKQNFLSKDDNKEAFCHS